MQELATTARAFVFLAKYIIAKYLQQEVDGDLSVCVHEHSFFITEDLSMARDQKVMILLPPMKKKCPMGFYQGVVSTAKV